MIENMTDEQAQKQLDRLRADHAINGALQDLAAFIIHTKENKGIITAESALYLVEAAERAVDALLTECRGLSDENDRISRELIFITAGVNVAGNA